jgi:diguanylate cyclase (GGDEF)-like protein
MDEKARQTLELETAPPTMMAPPSEGGEDPSALDAADLRIGGHVAITMFAAGAALLPVTALPIREMVDLTAVVLIGAVSLLCAAVFAVLTRTGRITPERLYAGDYVWVGLTAGLVAASGGMSSPFFLLYPLPVLHAGAFQSRGRLTVLTLVAVLAFLTPLAYDTGGTALFSAMAIIAVPPTVVVAWSLNVALTTLRRQRRELVAAEAEALLQARIDPLTGLGNFRMLWGALEAQAARARRHDERFSLIVLDLDRFKAVNDQVGHQEGDATLQAVAAALRSQLRAEDVCCRHGGDEFAVIAVGAGEVEAHDLSARLVAAVTRVRIRADAEMRLGATAGWATFDQPGSTPDSLMRGADAMLRERRNRHPGREAAPEGR